MRIWIGTVAIVLLAGCGAAGTNGAPAAAPAVTDCGTFTIGQGDTVPAAARDCLITATQAREPARLKVTWPTVEGDPIPELYEADSTGRVHVTSDTRSDRFGPKAVTTRVCADVTVVQERLTFGRCDPAR